MIPLSALSNAVPVISGGTPYVSGDFFYHKFTATDTFSVKGGQLACDVLLLAGGSGGGATSGGASGGGGGAGGLLLLENQRVFGDYVVTIGAGGAIQTDGNSSTFETLTAADSGGK